MVTKLFRKITIGLALVLIAAGLEAVAPSVASAATPVFDAGNIISDANFYNTNAMTQAQIQAFLVSQETSCVSTATVTCLKDFTQTTFDRAAVNSQHCSAYTGAANELASTIIFKVAQACRINPEVFLVTLQKEEGLVTSKAATAGVYQEAMGYGCSDSAPTCDANYFGFYNQIYWAGWTFREDTYKPVRTYEIGNVSIAYAPGCASSVVDIQDQATADLYNYTPYQPDAQALAGVSGACSSFGNLNFFKIYDSWFGSPTGSIDPFGSVDTVEGLPGAIYLQGWVIDPDTTDSIPVHVYVDGVGTAITADLSRPDVGALYPAAGPDHGFSTTIPITTGGSHQVCIYGINIGPGQNTLLGSCWTVSTPSGSPFGVLDYATPGTGTITVSGWAIDPDTASPISVIADVDSTPTTSVANIPRDDVAAAYPGYGSAHAYSMTLTATPGTHQVCITAVNVGAGTDTQLPCRQVVVPGQTSTMPDLGRAPFGVVDAVTETSSSVTVAGWAIDPDTASPIQVHVYLDSTGVNVTADGPRADVAAAYPGYGPDHEYVATLAATPGTHDLCVYAINNSTNGPSNTQLTCHLISVPYPPGTMPDLGRAPFGVVDAVTETSSSVTVAGWAIDPDTASPIQVHVYLDSTGVNVTADGPRADVAAAYPGYGPDHEYVATLAATPGTHDLCVYAINNSTNGPSNTQLTCHLISVPYPPGTMPDLGRAPFGVVDAVTETSSSVTVAGWAIDPDTASPIQVHVYLDSTGVNVTADGPRADVAAAYPGYGPDHEYVATLAATPGTHDLCVYAINNSTNGPSNTQLTCHLISVP